MACIPGSTKSCMTLNTVGAVSSAPIGRSVMPAAIWKKDTTPAGTAIALDAIILPGENGWTPGSRIYCPYPITIVFLPYHMSSIRILLKFRGKNYIIYEVPFLINYTDKFINTSKKPTVRFQNL